MKSYEPRGEGWRRGEDREYSILKIEIMECSALREEEEEKR